MAEAFLLDTHVFLWWITADPRLSECAGAAISSPKHRILLSAVSGWEIAIKARLGRLENVGDPVLSVPFHAKRSSIEIVDFPCEAALQVYHLPALHEDPFDRALIAHARVLGVPLISSDPDVKRYPLDVVW